MHSCQIEVGLFRYVVYPVQLEAGRFWLEPGLPRQAGPD